MTTEKTTIYKPHIAQAALFMSLSAFMCFFTYFFFDMRKEVERCRVDIRKSDLRIEELETERKRIELDIIEGDRFRKEKNGEK